MKTGLIALGCIISFSSFVHAVVPCPDACLIVSKIDSFRGSLSDEMETGRVTLDGQTWNFESDISRSIVGSVKSLNREIADIDLHTCNYLIYLRDSKIEHASLLLHQRSTRRY